MKISIIVAANAEYVIGKDNRLPWHIPEDLKRFKKLTWGSPILMGRKTFESIGRPLPGRHNLVLSSQESYRAEGISMFPTFKHAMNYASQSLKSAEIFVIGGAAVYRDALPIADRVLLTQVDKTVDGDVFFPKISEDIFFSTQGEWQTSAGPEGLRFRYLEYHRI